MVEGGKLEASTTAFYDASRLAGSTPETILEGYELEDTSLRAVPPEKMVSKLSQNA
jgi:hypothetical protein